MILRALGQVGSDICVFPRRTRPEPPIQAAQSMLQVRTSQNDPIRIGEVSPGDGSGRIGITLCPGKKDAHAWKGPADRDLGLDLDEVQRWGATAVISLITEKEIDSLQVRGLCEAVEERHMEWWHLPIPDMNPPGSDFERGWRIAGEAIRDRLCMGFDVLVHCKGGLGRAGTVAARLLVELGGNWEDAVRKVRKARSDDAIETEEQELHIQRCEPPISLAPSITKEGVRDRAMGPCSDLRWVMLWGQRWNSKGEIRSRGSSISLGEDHSNFGPVAGLTTRPWRWLSLKACWHRRALTAGT